MTVKELIDKLQQFNGDRVVLVEDTEYGEFHVIDVEPVDDRFVIITTTVKQLTLMLMVYMLYVKLALIELALLNLMISLDPLRVLRTLRYTPRRGWNGSCASNISIVINDNNYID